MKEKIRQTIQIVREKASLVKEKTAGEYLPAVKKRIAGLYETGRERTPVWKHGFVAFVLKWWRLATGVLFACLVLYYPAGAFLTHHIDVDPDFQASLSDERGPVLPSTLSALIGREISARTFTPNKPFFHPSAVLDDMPAFQTGVITGIKDITEILSVVNAQSENLTGAAERLAYSPTVWHIEKWKPAVSSVKKYKKARDLLAAYGKNAAEGTENFNRSAEALRSVVEQMTTGMEEAVQTLASHVRSGERKITDARADDTFYAVKGRLYVYLLTLRDLKKDFANVFADKKAEELRRRAESSLEKAVLLRPAFVANGSPESQIIPNHLLNAGFYLSSAVSELKELENEMQAGNE